MLLPFLKSATLLSGVFFGGGLSSTGAGFFIVFRWVLLIGWVQRGLFDASNIS